MFQYWPILFGLKTVVSAGRRMMESGRNLLGFTDAPPVASMTDWALNLVGAALDPATWLGHITGGLLALFAGWKVFGWLFGKRRKATGSYIAYAVPAALIPAAQAVLTEAKVVHQLGAPGHGEQMLWVAAYHQGVFERQLNRRRIPYHRGDR